jgi:hypothetical protein
MFCSVVVMNNKSSSENVRMKKEEKGYTIQHHSKKRKTEEKIEAMIVGKRALPSSALCKQLTNPRVFTTSARVLQTNQQDHTTKSSPKATQARATTTKAASHS